MNDEKIILKIEATKDYDMFKFSQSNRPIGPCEKLRENIEKDNKLYTHPIIIDKNFEIIDGQHRWQVAKEKNLWLYYIVDPHHGSFDLIGHNTSSKSWKLENYAHFYANYEGNEISNETKNLYKWVVNLKLKYQITYDFMLRTFLTSEKGRDNCSINNGFKKGKIKLISTYNFLQIEENIIIIKEINYTFHNKKLIKKNHDQLNIALFNLINLEGFNINKFFQKTDRFFEETILALKFKNASEIFDRLLVIYNKYSKNPLE